jgi:hypothetical protein
MSQTEDFDGIRVIGTPYRSTHYHTSRCRHVKRAVTRGTEIVEPSEAAVEYHELEHCSSCDGGHDIHNRGPVPDV